MRTAEASPFILSHISERVLSGQLRWNRIGALCQERDCLSARGSVKYGRVLLCVIWNIMEIAASN